MATMTPQQRDALRASKAARAVHRKFPEGARVTSADHDTGVFGTVKRHIPMRNAQGGILVIEWDTGVTGRSGAISLRVVAP